MRVQDAPTVWREHRQSRRATHRLLAKTNLTVAKTNPVLGLRRRLPGAYLAVIAAGGNPEASQREETPSGFRESPARVVSEGPTRIRPSGRMRDRSFGFGNVESVAQVTETPDGPGVLGDGGPAVARL